MADSADVPGREPLAFDPKRSIGAWCTLPGTFPAELFARLGFGYVCIDRQHGLMSESDALAAVALVGSLGTVAAVRVSAADPVEIGRVLDAGATVVIVPMIESADQAARAAAACRYAPLGSRSFGPLRPMMVHGTADPALIDSPVRCVAMIESAAAVDRAEEISAAPGVDGIYIGPGDLAISLGLDPATANRSPSFRAALEHVIVSAHSAGRRVGLHCHDATGARSALASGFDFATACADSTILQHGATAEAAHLNLTPLLAPTSMGTPRTR